MIDNTAWEIPVKELSTAVNNQTTAGKFTWMASYKLQYIDGTHESHKTCYIYSRWYGTYTKKMFNMETPSNYRGCFCLHVYS